MRARAQTPREMAELPYAHRLEPFTGRLVRDDDHESVLFDGCVFEDPDAGGSAFGECAFANTSFDRGRYRRCRFDDVWWHTVRMVGVDLVETEWLDVEFAAGVLAGTEISGSRLRRVTFRNCKFDSVNARMAHLRDVFFVDCLLRDVDFGGATLTDVAFPGSTLERVRLDRTKLTKVDLREANGLGIASGLDALAGTTINTGQLLDLAPAFAQLLGITVQDGPPGAGHP
ncbi:pentapeptide repeat-containing protein [Streptomyces sp. SID3343]|uniref:pentapeptide repeat-containing protein n=1 Tax=Streptomyces sp. SID3343 TaxID=2690260 RepID=UPI0031FA32A7